MANTSLPPDSNEQEKQEYARWLDSAIGTLRTAEIEETYDNLFSILTSKDYVQLSASQSEGGYPSATGFIKLAPELRVRKLGTMVRSADDLQEATILLLDNLAESDPARALALIGDLERRTTSAKFRSELVRAASIAHLTQAEALHHIGPHPDFAALKDVPELLDAPSIVPDKNEEDTLEASRPVRRPKKVSHMGQNPGDDIFITGDKGG